MRTVATHTRCELLYLLSAPPQNANKAGKMLQMPCMYSCYSGLGELHSQRNAVSAAVAVAAFAHNMPTAVNDTRYSTVKCH